MDIKSMKRNELDILLTDLLPVEVSYLFTTSYFYEFLINKKKKDLIEIERNLSSIKYSENQVIFDKWHATPLKYKVYKGNNELREISIMNPFSMLQIYFFVKLFNDELIDKLNYNPHFSIRYHKKNNDLYYKYSKKGIVKYEDKNLKKNKYSRALETSGIFYKIEPFSMLSDFYDSDRWFSLNTQYRYFAKIDYKDCFGSIYSHTFKWMVSNNTIDSRGFSNNHLCSVIDRVIQQINSSISNGIIVGPEFSRMIAEILMQHIDSEVFNQLVLSQLQQGIDYDICRYIDDIYIFVNDENHINKIKRLYADSSSKFQLKFNELKNIEDRLPYIWNEWKRDAKCYVDKLVERTFYRRGEKSEYHIKAKRFTYIKNVASLKEDLQNLLASYPNQREKIISYIFTALLNGIKSVGKRKLFRVGVSDIEITKILEFVMHLYSFAPTFRNTRKIICIEYLFKKEIDTLKFNYILQLVMKKYEYIFINANLPDIVDLLLVSTKNNCEFSILVEEKLWKKVLEHDNPILAANFLIYTRYNKKFFNKIINDIEQIIINKISLIKNKHNSLLYKEFWWIFVFINCPYIGEPVQVGMEEKIKMFLPTANDTKSNILKLLYEFLTDVTFPYKFVDWDTNKELLEEIAYSTYERTLFRNVKNDIAEY